MLRGVNLDHEQDVYWLYSTRILPGQVGPLLLICTIVFRYGCFTFSVTSVKIKMNKNEQKQRRPRLHQLHHSAYVVPFEQKQGPSSLPHAWLMPLGLVFHRAGHMSDKNSEMLLMRAEGGRCLKLQ